VARVLDGTEAGHEELPIEVVLRASTGGAPADALPLPFATGGMP
jgi:hypothetical protein